MHKRLVLLDLDGTLLMGHSLRVLTAAFGLDGERRVIEQEAAACEPSRRDFSQRIAGIFAGKRFDEVAKVFDGIPLTPGAVGWVRTLRTAGHAVHIVSGSWRPLAERLARRLSLDGVWANGLELKGGRITGTLHAPPCPENLPEPCRRHSVCKAHALEVLAQQENVAVEDTVAVGDGPIDVCMLRMAGIGVALNPKEEEVAQAADIVVYGDFFDVEEQLTPFFARPCPT